MASTTHPSSPSPQQHGSKRRRLGIALSWIALLLPAAALAYGFVEQKLLSQHIWHPEGLRRMLYLAAAFALWYIVWRFIFARGFVLATAIAALAYAMYFVGPIAVVAVAFFSASCIATGQLLLKSNNAPLPFVAGLACWMWVISLAAHTPVNYPLTYAIAFAIPLLFQGRKVAGQLRDQLRHLEARPTIPSATMLFLLLAHWLVVLNPEVSYDGLAMHLVVPAQVAQQHAWHFDVDRLIWAVMPMGGDWAFTAAYLLGGEAAARLLNFAVLLALATLLYRAVRPWLPSPMASLVTALFLSTPLVQLVTGSMMVENFWAATLFASLLSAVEFRATRKRRWLYVTALLAGAAIATKFGAGVFAIAVVCLAIWEAVRRRGKVQYAAAALALLAFGAFAAPPYVTAWAKTGNPVFPFMNAVFRSPQFNTGESFFGSRFGGSLSWRTPYDITVETSRFLEGQDGAFGFVWLLLVPVSLLMLRRNSPFLAWAATVVGLLFCVLTLLVQANARYIYPCLPLFGVAIGYALSQAQLRSRKVHKAMIAVAAIALLLQLYFLPAASWYHKEFFLPDRTAVAKYLEYSAPVRSLVEWLNTHAPGEPVAFFETAQIAGLRGRAYANTWHHWRFVKRVNEASTPVEVLRTLNEANIKWMVAPDLNSTVVVAFPTTRMLLEKLARPIESSGHYVVSRIEEGFDQPDGWKSAAAGEWALHTMPPGTYDDFAPRITFRGAWIRDRQFRDARNGTLTYSKTPGAEAEFWFQGTEITFVFTKAANRGIVEVFIDGQPAAVINQNSTVTAWQQKMVFSGLSKGDHKLLIRAARSNASDQFIDVDTLIVR